MPAEYTQEIGDELCFGLAQGKSLVAVCREMGIEYRLVFEWLKKEPEFANNYAHAREAQADFLADGILDVADDATIPPDDRRVRIDARKWYAGKLKPKKYGDRTALDHGGQDSNPVKIDASVTLSPDEAYRQMLNRPSA